MPATLQQHRAAESSARVRQSRKLIRELQQARPLTAQQRAEIIAAAAAIPTTEGYLGTGSK